MTFKDKPKRPGSRPPARSKQASPGAKGVRTKTLKEAPVKTSAADAEGAGKGERISKLMARAGVASRRDIERMIMEGRVKLNGVLLDTPVVNVTLEDAIEVDGVPIRGIERTRLWLYHKPAGLVTTNSDPEGRRTVFENLPEELPRVMSIGRLDINTEGLLLLTNDGGLARVLELPTTGWLRRYRVRAHGEIDQARLDTLKDGIAVDGVLYGSIEATLDREQGSNVWITMGLREGKNREIKNVLGALGLDVNRLIRISYGPFQLGELPEGHVLEVRGRTLRDQLGPRLIEDSKANFDAPVYNAPAVAAEEEADAVAERGSARDDWAKREKPSDKRERALSRLDTRRDDRKDGGRKDSGRKEAGRKDKDDDRPRKHTPLGQKRSANVWMAPGARPLGEKAAAKAAKNAKTSARRGESEHPQRGGSTRPPAEHRVQVNRVREEDGEWIRSSEPVGKAGDREEGFDRKRSFGGRSERSFGDRPPRGDKPFSGKPRGDRKPRGEGDERPRAKSFQGEGRSERPRSFGDRPARAERPFGDRPSRGDRPYTGKPGGDRKPRAEGDERPRAKSFQGEGRSEKPRSFGDRPARAERPFGDRPPRGDRPYTGKPDGDRGPRPEGDERPRAKSFHGEGRSEKPRGDKPSGGKPGGKSFGKPAGKSFGKPAGKGFSGKSQGGRPGGDKPAGGGGKGKGMTRGADRRR
ncbi:pseudouridine synthase [Rhizobium sp. BK251]|uniref:pseudouridine synthase n=1 Tax=Rhizobium sp. BK251 TaxID=2512125 RepID=UPI00104940CE|nr:pseudouridine synthase [Rhizobium sp. BK251]TCL75817.1 23S rRNA pseudouridine2605 synthase [Rhizobium sp. BK251]